MDSTFWPNKPKRRSQLFFALRVVPPAHYPENPFNFKPNRLAILLVSIILGIGGGVGYGSAAQFTDRSVKTTDDLFGATHISVQDFYLSPQYDCPNLPQRNSLRIPQGGRGRQSSQRKNQTNYSSPTIGYARATLSKTEGERGRDNVRSCILADVSIPAELGRRVRADQIPLTLRQR